MMNQLRNIIGKHEDEKLSSYKFTFKLKFNYDPLKFTLEMLHEQQQHQ